MLRGSSEQEPSPSNRAWSKTRLSPGLPHQTNSGTHLCSLVRPSISASGLLRSAARFCTSSSWQRLPDLIVRVMNVHLQDFSLDEVELLKSFLRRMLDNGGTLSPELRAVHRAPEELPEK